MYPVKLVGTIMAILALGGAGVAAHGQAAPSDVDVILQAHNSERVGTGVPALTWNAQLAGQAGLWAEQLARDGVLRHASAAERSDAGENLWMGSPGYFSTERMVSAFIAEKRHYRHGSFPNVSATGNWQDVGHYTQIVWRDTQQIGCAVARTAQRDVLVCRYWPAGNRIGSQPY